ncbi:MAG: peptide ABC transporter ATPase [Candidatus Bathyarchaeota archaeon B24]|nr:MAG: peptide ABC transporter ATPase [Candidatus Bathyarchaeota archaeon B24]
MRPILSIKGLSVEYLSPRGRVKAVRNVNLEVYKGEILFLVGESGAGKSTLGLTLLKLLPEGIAKVVGGEVIYHRDDGGNLNILKLRKGRLRRFRWKEVAMVFQGAMNSLNPIMKIKDQMYDVIKDHGVRLSKREAYKKIEELLAMVRLDAKRVLKSYPHQLSGGMKQRVMIAMSLLLDPKLLILDEPTTALDVLTQKNIMNVLKDIRDKLHLTMIFITHDLSLAAELADRIAIMYAGSIVEVGSVEQIFYRPKHPYTHGLLKSVPKLTSEIGKLESIPGFPPDMINLPPGCKFHPRCVFRRDICMEKEPFLQKVEENHYTACWRWRDIFGEE